MFGNVAVADIVLTGEPLLQRNDRINYIEKLVKTVFTDNPAFSTRQIPAYFRFRESMPLTANSKTDFAALGRESLNGEEIKVVIEETNISINGITVK